MRLLKTLRIIVFSMAAFILSGMLFASVSIHAASTESKMEKRIVNEGELLAYAEFTNIGNVKEFKKGTVFSDGDTISFGEDYVYFTDGEEVLRAKGLVAFTDFHINEVYIGFIAYPIKQSDNNTYITDDSNLEYQYTSFRGEVHWGGDYLHRFGFNVGHATGFTMKKGDGTEQNPFVIEIVDSKSTAPVDEDNKNEGTKDNKEPESSDNKKDETKDKNEPESSTNKEEEKKDLYNPDLKNYDWIFMFTPEYKTFGLNMYNLNPDAKVKVTVNNKKYASVKWDEEEKIAWVTANKICSIKVTFKVTQNNNSYKQVTNMKWVKYKNPLKSVKIGSKKYDVKYFDTNTSAGMKEITGKSKVNIKLKKGYTLTGLDIKRGGKLVNITNGSSVNFTKKGTENTVIFIRYIDPSGYPGDLRLFAWTEDCTL